VACMFAGQVSGTDSRLRPTKYAAIALSWASCLMTKCCRSGGRPESVINAIAVIRLSRGRMKRDHLISKNSLSQGIVGNVIVRILQHINLNQATGLDQQVFAVRA